MPTSNCPIRLIVFQNGIYYYESKYCPSGQPGVLLSDYARNLGGCGPNGEPGPDCSVIPPPSLTPETPSEPTSVASSLGGVGSSLGSRVSVSAILLKNGIARAVQWSDPAIIPHDGSRVVETLNCRFRHPGSSTAHVARLYLFLTHRHSPIGVSETPGLFGLGFELDKNSIPSVGAAEIHEISDRDVTALGAAVCTLRLHTTEFHVVLAGE